MSDTCVRSSLLSSLELSRHGPQRVYTARQALSTARFCRTGQLAIADTWFRTCRLVSALLRGSWQDFN